MTDSNQDPPWWEHRLYHANKRLIQENAELREALEQLPRLIADFISQTYVRIEQANAEGLENPVTVDQIRERIDNLPPTVQVDVPRSDGTTDTYHVKRDLPPIMLRPMDFNDSINGYTVVDFVPHTEEDDIP